MLTEKNLKDMKIFFLVYHRKSSFGDCDSKSEANTTKEPEQLLNEEEGIEEIYEDPVFWSLHGSQILLVLLSTIIFIVLIVYIKRKGRQHVKNLRSDTCVAINKLAARALPDDMTSP